MNAKEMLAIVASAVHELDAEHRPQWADYRAEETGKDPIGCQICFPGDGSWPCVTRMVADDLRALLLPGNVEPEEPDKDPLLDNICHARRYNGQDTFYGDHDPHLFTYGPHGRYTGSCVGWPRKTPT
jgi:hypothetical protein